MTASMTRRRPPDCSRRLETEANIDDVLFRSALAAEVERAGAENPALVGRFPERSDLGVPIRAQRGSFGVVAVGEAPGAVDSLRAEVDTLRSHPRQARREEIARDKRDLGDSLRHLEVAGVILEVDIG